MTAMADRPGICDSGGVEVGVHLPQAPLGTATVADAVTAARHVTSAARDHGFVAISANDHFTFSGPWIDGPTLLAAVAGRAGDLDLMTSIGLPTLRGPVAYAAALTTLAAIADGRVIAGVGPGSSPADHALTGHAWQHRWSRWEETVQVLRSLLDGHGIPAGLQWHAPAGQPTAVLCDVPRPALWLASWGSAAGLRRVARHGEGWIASAHHGRPADFRVAKAALDAELTRVGRSSAAFEHAVVTVWTCVTDDPAAAARARDVLASALRVAPADLRGRVCIGSVEECAQLVAAYAAAGCQRLHFWPISDEVRQLELLAHRVLPMSTG